MRIVTERIDACYQCSYGCSDDANSGKYTCGETGLEIPPHLWSFGFPAFCPHPDPNKGLTGDAALVQALSAASERINLYSRQNQHWSHGFDANAELESITRRLVLAFKSLDAPTDPKSEVHTSFSASEEHLASAVVQIMDIAAEFGLLLPDVIAVRLQSKMR